MYIEKKLFMISYTRLSSRTIIYWSLQLKCDCDGDCECWPWPERGYLRRAIITPAYKNIIVSKINILLLLDLGSQRRIRYVNS